VRRSAVRVQGDRQAAGASRVRRLPGVPVRERGRLGRRDQRRGRLSLRGRRDAGRPARAHRGRLFGTGTGRVQAVGARVPPVAMVDDEGRPASGRRRVRRRGRDAVTPTLARGRNVKRHFGRSARR